MAGGAQSVNLKAQERQFIVLDNGQLFSFATDRKERPETTAGSLDRTFCPKGVGGGPGMHYQEGRVVRESAVGG